MDGSTGYVESEETYSTYQVGMACGYAVNRLSGSCSALTAWRRDLNLPSGGSGSKTRWTFRDALSIYIGKNFDHPFNVRVAYLVRDYYLTDRTLFVSPKLMGTFATPERLLQTWEREGYPTGTIINLGNEMRKLQEALKTAAPIG